MPLPDYQVEVVNPFTGETIAIYDGTAIQSLRYSRVLNDVGKLALEFDRDIDLTPQFPVDTIIEVTRTSPITGQLQVEDTYLSRITTRLREGDVERFVIGAVSLNHLILRRLVDPTDDPAAVGGYSIKSGAADDVMRGYAREALGDLASAARQMTGVSVAPVGSVGLLVGRRIRYENLLTVFQSLCEQGNMDFTVRRVQTNVIRVDIAPIGTDRTYTTNYPFAPFVYLTPESGNLTAPQLTLDRKDETNFCYALGQGPGEQRIVLTLQGEGITDSPYNRVEFSIDSRISERGNALELLTSARNALFENRQQQEFSFNPTGNEPGCTYQQDWFLGDRVTAAWGDVRIDLRIREVEIQISERGEDIKATLEPI